MAGSLDHVCPSSLSPRIIERQRPGDRHGLFATGNDADNRAAVRRVVTEGLDLVGLTLHADRKEVDTVVKGLSLRG